MKVIIPRGIVAFFYTYNLEQQGTILKEFQLNDLSIKDKSDKAYGFRMSQYINSTIGSGISSYYWARNNRYKLNRNSANGRVNMGKFQDLLDFNGKVNYANINWQSIRIVNRIISGLIGRWMQRNEKIQVSATDTLSTTEKIEEYKNLEFVLYNREMLEKLQEESGVQMMPQGEIPETKEELDMWATQYQRLPEEIGFEMGCNDALTANGWFDVLKEKMLHDSAEVGLVGTYTWMDDDGVIHIDYVKPENAVYSYSEYPDFRDTTWRGQIKSMKISELRQKYGKQYHPENPNALTEEELWNIAGASKDYQFQDKIRWDVNYNVTMFRPYDEWNVDVLDFEVKSFDNEDFTITTTKNNKSTLIKKGRSEKRKDNEEVVSNSKWNIYRGVFIRNPEKLLEWGVKRNMIRPNDPKEIGNAEFSYSFYMYQSYNMTNIAVPEKIEEPADQMILARLKMQQLVAKMRPTGALINWDALQNIDYGLGENNTTIDVMKLYDQTGTLYYRGRDAEGNPVPVPIQELSNSGFLPQMKGLIELYNFHYQVLKDELGEDPNLIAQALQPRVTSGNVDASERAGENATDYMYNAYIECMKQTARKVSCLLKTSVMFGAKAYRHLIKAEDVTSRVFNTEVKMLPTTQEIMLLDQKMNQAIASNPEFALYIDTFKILRIAREDVKLAEEYYRLCMKKMLETQQKNALQNQQMTIQGQIASAKAAEEEKRKSLQMELDTKKQISDTETSNKLKEIIVQGAFQVMSKGIDVQPEWKAVIDEVIHNIALPLFAENTNNMQMASQQPAPQFGQQQPQPEQEMAEQEQPQEQQIEGEQGEQQEAMQPVMQ